MGDKKQLKIKLSIAILISIIVILLICAIIYFTVFYDKNTENNNQTQLGEVQQNSTTDDIAKDNARAEELEAILRDNLPKMDGSTSTIPLEGGILAALFDISQEDAEAGIVHSTTYGSFDNLMEGNCDIIFSTPLSQAQYDTAQANNITLEVVPIVYEGFVFVVNASNPVDTLTQQQLRDIYSGKITNWKEVGGNDAEIVAYQRNETSGSQNYMTAFMGNTKLMEPVTDFIPASMVGLMDAIATYDNAENAIGYSVYAYAADMYGNGNEIKFIKVDGVEPTKATMASKEYPLLNYNYAIYDKSKENSTTVDELVEWILTYKGQIAMANAGYIPIKNVEAEEITVVPYTKKGTGTIKPNDYVLDAICYSVSSWDVIQDNKLVGLQNEELQNTINQFIDNASNALNNKKQQLDNYINLLNSKDSEFPYYGYTKAEEDPIVVEVECINGYLSVQVYLGYVCEAQRGTYYIYDGESAIFDLYTGEKLELSDLYFQNTDFISNINQSIKYYEEHTPELTPERTFKRTFTGVLNNIKMYSLTQIEFTKYNPCFADGEIFDFSNNYQDAINKVIYVARDMQGIWDSSIEVYKNENSFDCTVSYLRKEQDNLIYNIDVINTNNETVDTKINSYIQEYLETNATPEEINNYISENDNYIENGSDMEVTAYVTAYGSKVARIAINIDWSTYDEFYMDLQTGELLNITTYDEFENYLGLD